VGCRSDAFSSRIILRLTVAAALGAIIGLERVVRRRPAVSGQASLYAWLRRFSPFSPTNWRTASEIRAARESLPTSSRASVFLERAPFCADRGASRDDHRSDDLCGGRHRHGRWWRPVRRRWLFDGAGALWLDGYRVGEQYFNLKCRLMAFRITTSHAESVATEVQRLMAGLKIPMQHFRVSMAGATSIVNSRRM